MAGIRIESVPNFSEGRNLAVIQGIAQALDSVPGAALLHQDSGFDANRTVYTLAGSPDAVILALKAGARAAYGLIDMATQTGSHPRMGALDVLPLIPLSGITMEETDALAASLAADLAGELDVPVYLYARSARAESRRELSDIRRGGYEDLRRKLADDAWAPDFGPRRFVPRWGATACGARDFLIAWNVNLSTQDAAVAKAIAAELRKAGAGGERRFPGLRAMGWFMEEFGCAQVSLNVYDFRAAPLSRIYAAVAELAADLGYSVRGSELVGMVPLEALLAAGAEVLGLMAADPDRAVAAAVRGLGLDALEPFDPDTRILERALAKKGIGPD